MDMIYLLTRESTYLISTFPSSSLQRQVSFDDFLDCCYFYFTPKLQLQLEQRVLVFSNLQQTVIVPPTSSKQGQTLLKLVCIPFGSCHLDLVWNKCISRLVVLCVLGTLFMRRNA